MSDQEQPAPYCYCGARHPYWGLVCTKRRGHRGHVHTARGMLGEVLKRWRDDEMKVERSNEDQHFRIQVTVQSITPEGNSLMSANPERAAFVATQAATDAADKLGRDLVEAEGLRREKRG